jgi:hypothetical protein
MYGTGVLEFGGTDFISASIFDLLLQLPDLGTVQ